MRRNKKAQVYPIFVIIFTIAALTFAYIAVQNSQKMNDFIGNKQSQFFGTLQQSETNNIFIEKSAELAASDAVKDFGKSCMVDYGVESIKDPLASDCGKFLYPLWSTEESLCLPDCKDAFLNSFVKELSSRAEGYYRATGVRIPPYYNIALEPLDDYFLIHGVSSSKTDFNILKRTEGGIEPLVAEQGFLAEGEKETTETPPESTTPPETAPASDNLASGLFIWAVDNPDRTAVSCFGHRVVSGGSKNHPGLDERGKYGDSVLAAANGRVVALDLCWGRVVLDHGQGLKTEYLHMSVISVKINQVVEKGGKIGEVGGRGCVKHLYTDPVAYTPHLHFAVMYDDVQKGMIYEGQVLNVGNGFSSNYVSPLCFMDTSTFTFKRENNAECFTPVNTELDEVCPLYNFPDFRAVGSVVSSQSSVSSSNSVTASAIESISGASTAEESKITTKSSIGTYSFTPAFSVRVNKKLEEPVKEVTDWFSKTWESCQEDFSGCLKTEMDKYNSVESRGFDLSFADHCEDNPIFFNIMEFMEDCFSNEAYGCGCTFDASGLRSRKDMSISFTLAGENSKAELFFKDDPEAKESHSFFFGTLKSAIAKQERFDYQLDFNEKTGELISAKLIPYSKSGDEFVAQEGSAFNDYKTLRLVKPTETGSGMFNNDPNILDCVYTKDKFRLCAKPLKNSLPLLKFSVWMKEKPPEELKEGSLSVTPRDPCQETELDKLLNVKGIDLMKIASNIPVLATAANAISLADLMNSLEATKPTSLQVVVNNPDPDVAGYQVYCNDMLLDSLPADFLKSHNPNNFVAIANNQIQPQVSQLDNFVQTNPYADFLEGYDCDVPVVGTGGKTVKVPAIKGLEKDGNTIFDIGSCGSLPVALDKMLPKNYCVTLIPVDKNGRKLEGKSLTNCAKTNSLLNLVIKDLLDKKLGAYMTIAESFLPDELSPGIQSPCSGKISSAAAGGGFNLMELANFKDVDSIKNYIDSFATKEINKELASISFLNTVDSMDNFWSKQLVLGTLSKDLEDEDARILFNDMLSGNTRTGVQNFVMEKGLDYVDDEKASEIVRESLSSGDVSSVAMEEISTMLDESLSSEEKKEDMMFLINNRDAGELTNNILNKAQQTSCGQRLKDDDVEAALGCLNSGDIEIIYSEALDSYGGSQEGIELAQKGLDRLQASDKKKAVSALMNGDAYGFASRAVQSELDKMPDNQKTAFVKDALQGKIPGAEEAQSELLRMIPAMNNDYVTALLRNQDVKGILKDKLKEELDKQLKSFFNSACSPKAKV